MDTTTKERAVLSTLIYGKIDKQNILKTIKDDFFQIESHQKIFQVICILHKEKITLDEVNIRAELNDEKYHNELSQIVTTDILEDRFFHAFIKEMKDTNLWLKLKSLPTSFNKAIEKEKDISKVITNLKSHIDSYEQELKTEIVDYNWKDALKTSQSLLTYEMLENTQEANQLIDGFIYENTVSVLHSKPGQGKTTLLLSLIKKMISDDKIDEFIYFDADNPQSVLKDRLPKLRDTFGNKMTYHTHTTSSYQYLMHEMKRLCLFKGQGKKIFIVVDTLGKFVTSVNDDKECKNIMDLLGELRDSFGATVVLVHHSNKNESELGKPVFRGSTVISGDCDFMWGLKRNGEKTTLYNDKGRLNYFEKINATVDLQDYDVTLHGTFDFHDDEDSEEDEQDEREVNLHNIKQFLRGKEWQPLSELYKHFKCTNKQRKSNKAKQQMIWEVINASKEYIEWNMEKGNKAKYRLINNEPIVTEYEVSDNIDDLSLFFDN